MKEGKEDRSVAFLSVNVNVDVNEFANQATSRQVAGAGTRTTQE